MKLIKKLYIPALIGLNLMIFGFLYLAVTQYFWPDIFIPKSSIATINITKLETYHERIPIADTHSMTEFGFTTGMAEWYPNKTCEIGNFCGFDCLSFKCQRGVEKSFLKKLVKIENNCYYFEGNTNPWRENGILVESFDFRVFGCLMPNEFRINGVFTP